MRKDASDLRQIISERYRVYSDRAKVVGTTILGPSERLLRDVDDSIAPVIAHLVPKRYITPTHPLKYRIVRAVIVG